MPLLPLFTARVRLPPTTLVPPVCVTTLPSFLATALIKVDPGYARKVQPTQ